LSAEKPNILLIMTDQQRYDSLGCYGVDGLHTPNLDQVAADGVVFENHYVNNPICTPTRASIHTGKPLPGHGVYQLYDDLPEEEVLFPERLREEGYKTALVGKMHVSSRLTESKRRHPHDGFDHYDWCMEPSIDLDSPFNAYSSWLKEEYPGFYDELKEKGRDLGHFPQEVHMSRWAAQRTAEYIRRWQDEGPFFIEMSVFDPHNPYRDYPKEMIDCLDPDLIPDPLTEGIEIEEKPRAVRREHEGSYLGSFDSFSEKDLQKMRMGYHASIAFLDKEVGRVLEALRATGLEKNTLIIFTSDHGDMLGDHQLLVKGAFFYDPCTKVPLIMKWPDRIEGGRRISGLSQPHDLAATILSSAGCRPEKLQKLMPESKDLTPVGEGERDEGHQYAVCAYRNTGINDNKDYFDPPIYGTMIRGERFKLNLYHDPSLSGDVEGELYDMENDGNELNDLWDDPSYREIRRELTEKLLNWETRQELKLGDRGRGITPDSSQKLDNRPT